MSVNGVTRKIESIIIRFKLQLELLDAKYCPYFLNSKDRHISMLSRKRVYITIVSRPKSEHIL